MRSDIHPDYVECKVTCSCGATFTTRSTKPTLHVELCSQCHPFYTGKQKFVDTGGRVQRFADKFGGAADTVIARDAAAKEARQKAHEEAEMQRREARATRDAAEAEREAAKPKAAKAEAPVDEQAAEAEAVEESAAEDVAADESASAGEEQDPGEEQGE